MPSTIVLVTGANSGVGYAVTKVIASQSEDFHVIMTSRSLEKGQAAMAEIEAAAPETKGRLTIVQLDVTDEKSIEQVERFVSETFGRLDVLINNAGVASLDSNVKSRLQICFETNVIGPAVVAEYFRPLLLKSPKPYSIYVGATGGALTTALEHRPPFKLDSSGGKSSPQNGYRSSKTALNMIMRLECMEFPAIKVFTVDPGMVVSNLRGTSEQARTGFGKAGDPEVFGHTLLRVIRGERDSEAGLFLHKDGVYQF